jgi:hypothetical protein
MKVRVLFASAALLLVLPNSHAAAADCPPVPAGPPPAIPDGDTATAEAMAVAQERVAAYVVTIEDYLDCRRGSRRIPSAMRNDLIKKAERASDRYNQEQGKFNARQGTAANS